MPKGVFIALIIVAGLIILIIAGQITFKRVQRNLEGLKDLSVVTPPLSSIKDGTYEGGFAMFPVKVKVAATIKEGTISDLQLLEHRSGQGQPAEAILAPVLTEQKLDVDTISGATYSSIVILKAIEDAMKKAQ
ncbi:MULTISPECIES: FMN-binding protein [Sphaerochaeta]|jgi:uncharacterized protein with FMN-binding domain|uniref:FMN-binding protein n=2 Tax=Sphaerochaeta TaxID=399320 RepID=A0ABY4DDQ6_9SPIR|nr:MULTISPECIES: FMN-binding protein [Sphaerochaeta]NLA96825.1 FMN-binding protein [Spirochaetales bacterium]MDD3423796.1 FMN-binding protein [Sphaerochaeta sp.]MDD3457402.1 FMN-binding protein [Sphaerochaeta sp.]MEA5027912.1 FMN-binding protein [Sphaerochaeta associata]UOM52388.1 FMN-binding protein [Sphaerochaeta associata]